MAEHKDGIISDLADRAAWRLRVLAMEAPDLLSGRLSDLSEEDLQRLIELTRLPKPLKPEPAESRAAAESGAESLPGYFLG
jgi:hypothetical protein